MITTTEKSVKNQENVTYKGYGIEVVSDGYQIVVDGALLSGEIASFVVADGFINLQAAKLWVDSEEKK